jgi:hypothetical protein
VAHYPEHLELARRHVAEADARIARQRVLLAELRAQGFPTELAVDLLASLMETARQMRLHYDYLRREV